ncbi:NAD-dependent epimerase/dehydratase family protein [Paenibacillus silagei]|uniref:Nucleoside-diphosphate-sugar epimerase n=1 Tax=Paenibacillus silagei TaxID=1670801 RepID=A0ABS4NLQ7_9BACL|nr:NAD-dependent epimerase/dehydratase family protein [Paenibacillus silagei]MBP2110999.1 nucleoside-diphosphate-sugar epimerase [Paenibacillus silagei]
MNLVIGGNGGLGHSITQELLSRGRLVKATYHRSSQALHRLRGPLLTLAAVDVRNEKVLAEALNGVTTVYFCLNVPYQDWYSVMPEALERVTRQLKSGQTLVFPGNIYGYGKLQYLPADERHPKEARTRKGKLRNQLEELLKTEAERRGFRYVIPRYPNYYGPNVTNRLFGPIFSGALQAKTIKWPVKLDVPHDLVYIRDAARAAVLLAESGEQGEWHVSGSGAIEGRQFLMNIHHAAGSPGKCCAVPSWAVGLAGVFNKEISEFHELLYEFEYPLLLNDNKFMMRFPEYNPTSYKRAIRETIEWFREELG